MSGDRESPRWLKMEVSLGTIIMAASILVATAGWAYTAAGKAEQAGKDLIDFQMRTSKDLSDFKSSVDRQFDGVNKQLDGINSRTAVLPTQQARLEQLLKQHDDDMARLGQLDGRIGSLEQRQVQTSTVLDGMLRPNLPPVRTTR